MKRLLILWTIVLATFVQTQETELPDCSIFDDFPWFVNNPINCRAYWYCGHTAAHPVPDECPNGFNFNEGGQMCDEEYECFDEPEDPDTTESPIITTTPRPRPPAGICEGLPDGRLVNNPTLCRAYFECRNEVAFDRQCEIGLNFNEKLQLCDRPSFTPCSNDDFECPFYGISRWEVPGSCNEFNFCFAGQHRVHTCAEGLIFDSKIGLCALQENVNCERDLCPLVNDIDNIVTYPSEVDCEQYYKCYDNNRELQWCAPGTHFNPVSQRCERPEDAGCVLPGDPTDDPITDDPTTDDPTTDDPTTEDPTTDDPPPFIECPPSDEPFALPHPTICQNYFLCFNEVAFPRRCLDGLLFDALETACNIADQTTCADGSSRRVTQQTNYFINQIAGRL